MQVKQRYSRQRELIYNIVKNRFDHPTADVIYEEAIKLEPNISLGTVYRNLKLLSEEKIIDTLETVDKKLHYDGDTTEHTHFVCSKCGKIIDYFTKVKVPQCMQDDCNKVMLTKSIFYGLCKDCLE